MSPRAKAQALTTMAREATAFARTAAEQAQAQAYPENADNFPANTRFGVNLTQPKSHPAPVNRRRRAPSPTMSEASTAPTLADVDGPETISAQRRQDLMQAIQATPQITQVFMAMEERYRAILIHHTDWNHEQVIAEMLSQCNGADEIFRVNQFSHWKLALQQ